MRIIQTLFLPDQDADPIDQSLGYVSPEFNWFSWALSVLQLRQFYGSVELYTNDRGYEVLINRLKLPYTKVAVVLNGLEFPPSLWVYPKLYTYSLQTRPFLHVDGDVYVWEKMNADILHSPLIAQNLETNHSFYLTLIREAMASGVAVPETVLEAMRQGRPLMAYNAGIIGGCDISFFKEYTREAFGLLAAAASRGGGTDLSRMNAIYEQVLFYCLAMRRKAAVTCYVKEEISDMTYAGYANFSEVPFNNRFIHLMGAFKKNHEVCYMLARRLRLSHPAWYYRIIRELRKSGVALFLSYYDGASDDWAAIYQQEKAQYRRIDSAFSTGEGLRRARFRVNSLLAPAGQAAYVLPFSYTLSHNEIKCDELDEVLISILRKPCPFDELLAAAGEYFEGSDLEGERESFVRLILLKLKRGCDSGLFEVVM